MGEVTERLRRRLALTEEQKAALLDKAGRAFAHAIAAEAPGKLGRSVQWQQDSATHGTVTMAGVTRYVVNPTRPHDITPRVKMALHWAGAAHPVGRVHHPGTKGNDFIRRAWHTSAVHAAVAEALVEGMAARPE